MNYTEYFEKVHGAWLGRVAGSHFGTPLEMRPYRLIQRRYCNGGKLDISSYVQNINPKHVNDDEIYEIVGLLTLEQKGVDITTQDLAVNWDKFLYGRQYTAEKAALKNIRKGIMPPDSALKNNIWYDAIGGQMKGDIWGLIAPGCPDVAAEYARIDGSIAHTGIGIDGEVFIAGMVANAFEISDVPELIEKSLTLLPPESQYRQFAELCVKIFENQPTWRDARREMVKEWQKILTDLKKTSNSRKRKTTFLKMIPAVHVLPNAGIIVLSLLFGHNDEEDPFGRPICIAGMMAMDTDCNCGNIGTIVGTIAGASQIPEIWIKPLNNEFYTLVKGYEDWKISELAKRICKQGVNVLKAKCPTNTIKEQ